MPPWMNSSCDASTAASRTASRNTGPTIFPSVPDADSRSTMKAKTWRRSTSGSIFLLSGFTMHGLHLYHYDMFLPVDFHTQERGQVNVPEKSAMP